MDLKCWQCGVAPLGVVEVTTLSSAEPSYLPMGWPQGDHPHAETAPTPGDLAERGDRARRRMLGIASE